MKITYILGNGFDIQLGLKSRYSDFLDEYTVVTDDDNDNIKAFKKVLISSKGRELWSDAEKAMGIYLREFSDESIRAYTEQIADFETKMIEFLEEEQARCDFSAKEKIRKVFSDFIFNSFNDVLNNRSQELDLDKHESHTVNFLSFNYTNLIDRVLDTFPNRNIRDRKYGAVSFIDKFGKILHVHGTLDSQIIMGVNDEKQLDTAGGVTINERLKWMFIKPVQNIQSNNAWDASAKKMIDESDIIAVYGVSFGITDKMWWEYLKKWLSHSAIHKLVVFKRDANESLNRKLTWQVLDSEDDLRRDILEKLTVEKDNIQKLRDQVYIVLNTTRLNMKDSLRHMLPMSFPTLPMPLSSIETLPNEDLNGILDLTPVGR